MDSLEELPLVQQVREWLDTVLPLVTDTNFWLNEVVTSWNLIQLGVLLALMLAAHLIARGGIPLLKRMILPLGNRDRLQRFLVMLINRTRSITLMILLWLALLVLGDVQEGEPLRLLRIASSLVTAWVIISILTKAMRNRAMSRSFAVVIWIIAALNILGVLPATLAALDGVALNVGDTRITALAVLNALFLSIVLIWVAFGVASLVEGRLERSQDLQPATRVLLAKLFRVAILGIAFVLALDLTGIDLTALAVFGGAVGLGLGFGLQKVISNLVSGFILLMDKSIKPGDVISLDNSFGWITRLNARYVSIITRDGREHLIPNEDLITNKVINWSHSHTRVRLEIEFGVAYDSNPHQVRELAIEAATDVERVLDNPKPVCHFTEFGDSSLNFVLRFWIQDPADGVVNIKGKVLLSLWDIFKEHEVGIPFPHREVIFRTPLEVVDARAEVSPEAEPEADAIEPDTETRAGEARPEV